MTARARKITITTIVGLIAIALAGSATAYWSTIGSGSGSASTGTLNPPSNLIFVQANDSSVQIGWTAASGSLPVTTYRVFRAGYAFPVCEVPGTSTTCLDGAVSASTPYTYTVTAYAASWTATSAPATFTTKQADPAPGAPVVTFPTANATYTTAAEWNAGCGTAAVGDFCGTATAASGQTLSKVQFSLKQGTSSWWNGTNFTGTTEQYFDVTGTTAWSQALAFPAVGSYVLNVKAVDTRPVESGITTVNFSIGTAAPATQSFDVELVAAGTKTAGTAFDVKLTAKSDASVLTSYTGAKTIVFSGPATSPGGIAPTYPATVTFANGVGTASVTLVKAETVSLAAADGARTGSVSVTVVAGTATKLAWTQVQAASGKSPTGLCYFTCTYANYDNQNLWTAKVVRTDDAGNPVVSAASQTITIARTAGSGTFQPGDTTASFTVTIPAGGSTSSTGGNGNTGQVTFKTPNGNWPTTSISASASPLAAASANFSK